MAEYPEHAKLRAIVDKSQVVGQFVDWLESEKGIHLAEYGTEEDTERHLFVALTPIRTLLAEFFDIDQKKLEAEKDAMLDEQRRLNGDGA